MSVQDTLKKVKKALDLRFEKDRTLYISKEDTDKIKQALSKSRFQNIQALIKKLGNKVVVKVILKNSWLISFNNKNRKYLENIFNSVDKSFLGEAVKDVVEDRIFSTTEFKTFIEGYYLQNIELRKCRKIYQNENKKIENRIICFERYLKEDYILNNSSSNSIRYINQELTAYPAIYNYLQNKKTHFLASIFKDTQDKDVIAKWIIENKLTDRKDIIWHNLFLSLENIAFKATVEYISSNPTWDDKITKYLIQKILKSFSKVTSFEDEIVELYENNYQIKLLFIRLLEPPKFKDKDLAHSILDKFEKNGFPRNSEKSVENIRKWKESQKGFISIAEIIDNIKQSNQDFSNKRLLEFYSIQFRQTDQNVILELYKNYKDEDKVIRIISYYLVTFLHKKDIPKHFKGIDAIAYIDKIAEYIERLYLKTNFAKRFLEENDKHEIVAKLNRR
jgi:hypothetical protein